MKKKLFPLLLSCLTLSPFMMHAQNVTVEKTAINTLLFTEFINGSVLMKNGSVEPAFLNYNSDDQTVVFKKGEEIMVLTGLDDVDTVYMSDRKFVPIENKVYEILAPAGKLSLFVSYTNKKRQLSASPDHTGTSRKTVDQVNNNVAQAYVSRPNQLNFTAEIQYNYWLRRGKSLYKANNENQITKAFAFKDDSLVKDYVKENKIDFKDKQEVVDLIAYCNKKAQ